MNAQEILERQKQLWLIHDEHRKNQQAHKDAAKLEGDRAEEVAGQIKALAEKYDSTQGELELEPRDESPIAGMPLS